jgi:hypothetical protein
MGPSFFQAYISKNPDGEKTKKYVFLVQYLSSLSQGASELLEFQWNEEIKRDSYTFSTGKEILLLH